MYEVAEVQHMLNYTVCRPLFTGKWLYRMLHIVRTSLNQVFSLVHKHLPTGQTSFRCAYFFCESANSLGPGWPVGRSAMNADVTFFISSHKVICFTLPLLRYLCHERDISPSYLPILNNLGYFFSSIIRRITWWLILLQINDLPRPSFLDKSLSEVGIGTFNGIETATEETTIITALEKFLDRRVSALPVIDSEGRLVDIFAKFDVIVCNLIIYFSRTIRRLVIFWIFKSH